MKQVGCAAGAAGQRRRRVFAFYVAASLLLFLTPLPAARPQRDTTPAPSAPGAEKRRDLIARDMGGSVEKFTSQYDENWSPWGLLDDRPTTERTWSTANLHFPQDFPQELVFSFFMRQPARVAAVLIDGKTRDPKKRWAKDVEIWTSMASADDGFAKVGEATLGNEPGEQRIDLPPTEARFIKIRILSNYGDTSHVGLGKVKVLEAEAPGYISMLQRYPDLAALVDHAPLEQVFGAPASAEVSPASSLPADSAKCDCVSVPLLGNLNPRHPESHKVLVISDRGQNYSPTTYSSTEHRGHVDYSIYGRLNFTVVAPRRARPADLLQASEIDTVVLAQVCDIAKSVPDDFKRALPVWLAAGHKLIIQDSDDCGPKREPDYSFLPYPFATGNPGAAGAASDLLIFVEENHLANAKPDDSSFLDAESWLKKLHENTNELGDSNLITRYDLHWCGHLFTTNVKHDNGFVEAYAHWGRGLVIYDGFDNDQHQGPEYRQIVTRELAQSFDPDGLPCSAKIGDFIITTDPKLVSQSMVPGKTYTYPLSLLSNHGYKGTIKLAFESEPNESAITPHFEPETIELTEISTSKLVLNTTGETPKGAHLLKVRGVDAAGKCNTLCLQLTERRTGALRVKNDLHRTAKPTKNLEIILDLSGSMKSRLGNSTRVETARKVLAEVLAKISDDFNVGLRFYGNRYGSRQKETCTDTQLVAPIAKLDRAKLLNLVNTTQPRGETPLVYSVLQTPSDLQKVGGGSVILITDGEESCGGDPAKAAEELKRAGVNINLDIVGFTLTGQKVQQQLTQFAEAAGGHYYHADNAQSLARSLLIAATEKIPYQVYDATGKQVAAGEAGDDGQELPPGQYKLVIKAADQQLGADRLMIESGKEATFTVTVNNDRFELESH